MKKGTTFPREHRSALLLARALALALACSLSSACAWALPSRAAMAQESGPVLGVCIYNGEDTFISSLLNVLQSEAEGRAELMVYDSKNDQNLQNDQMEEMLKAGVDALILNPVDRTTAVYQVQMAMQYDIPVVFINREPLREDLALYDKAYYVGIDPKQQGMLAGQLAADYFQTHPEADLNGDGRMQFVLFKGEPGHQDAELRTTYTLKALQDSGLQVELVSEETAMWDRSQAQELMSVLLSSHADQIECVISNNDDMALGAIDALKAAGYFSGKRTMPVIGIDATVPAMEALRQGSLYATVRNDALQQGRAAMTLALLLARGGQITPESFPYEAQDKVVYIPSVSCRMEEGTSAPQ